MPTKRWLKRMDVSWKEYFRDPLLFHDNRITKVNPNTPDFEHKFNGDSLCIRGFYNPLWVLTELTRRSSHGWLPIRKEIPVNGNSSEHHNGCFTLLELLKCCSKKKDLDKGTRLHADISKRGLLEKNPYIGSSVINMYAKCGLLAKAQEVHDELAVRSIESWNALIGGYVHQGHGQEALYCFDAMKNEGLSPDMVTYICTLKACGITDSITTGKQIHDEIFGRGLLKKSILLGTALIDMYVKCDALAKAQEVIEELPVRNVASWNVIIAAYAECNEGHKALYYYKLVKCEGLSPDAITFTCILKACGIMGAIDEGERIHYEIANRGILEKDIVLGNALVHMYVKCGMIAKAQEVHAGLFSQNVVTWNVLIAGYAQQEQGQMALNCFEKMKAKCVSPDVATYVSVLKACGSIGALHKGAEIHEEIVDLKLLDKCIVLGTALVDMYARCGLLKKAEEVLKGLTVRNIVSWNALIAGYTNCGQGHEALKCFERMLSEAFSPNAVTFTCILKACGSVGAIYRGKQIHDDINSLGLLQDDIVLGNALVDMYAKCGMLAKAQEVHDALFAHDVVSWNALITGYAHLGQGIEALHCFQQMQGEGFMPDAMTFLGVLNACGHAGQFNDVQTFFSNMSKRYGVTPDLQHCTCVVVVSAYLGCFNEAISVINTMPSLYDIPIWLALLTACKKCGNVELAKFAFNQTLKLSHICAAAYVLMADIYAAAGMRDDAERVKFMSSNIIQNLFNMPDDMCIKGHQ